MTHDPSLSFAGSAYAYAEPFEVSGISYDPREPQLFVHIPKTAGTTVHFVLMAALEERLQRSEASYQRFSVPRVAGVSPINIAPGWTGSWSEVTARAPTFVPPGERAFMSAHCPFGFHALLSLDRARYFTLVRDPVAREISSFNFQYQRGFLPATAQLTHLLDSGQVLDNPQVRMLAGRDAMSGACTETTYDLAVENLHRSFVLAASDRQTLPFIQALLGLYRLPPVAYVRSQVTGLKLSDRADRTLEQRLREFHTFDARLVEHVERQWHAWSARHTQPGVAANPADEILAVGPDFAMTQTAKRVRRADVCQSETGQDALVRLIAKE